MAQVYKVEIKQAAIVFIKADSEEQLMDWMNKHTPNNIDSNIICPVDGYEDFSIATED